MVIFRNSALISLETTLVSKQPLRAQDFYFLDSIFYLLEQLYGSYAQVCVTSGVPLLTDF